MQMPLEAFKGLPQAALERQLRSQSSIWKGYRAEWPPPAGEQMRAESSESRETSLMLFGLSKITVLQLLKL